MKNIYFQLFSSPANLHRTARALSAILSNIPHLAAPHELYSDLLPAMGLHGIETGEEIKGSARDLYVAAEAIIKTARDNFGPHPFDHATIFLPFPRPSTKEEATAIRFTTQSATVQIQNYTPGILEVIVKFNYQGYESHFLHGCIVGSVFKYAENQGNRLMDDFINPRSVVVTHKGSDDYDHKHRIIWTRKNVEDWNNDKPVYLYDDVFGEPKFIVSDVNYDSSRPYTPEDDLIYTIR